MKKFLTLKSFRYFSFAFAITFVVSIALFNAMTPEIATYDVLAKTSDEIARATTEPENWGAMLGGGIAAVGMIGAGIGQGYAAGKAAEAVGRNPEAETKIRNTMIIGAAIAESGALYALVISILVIFVG